MSKNNFILKRSWQSKSGVQEELYLGYNDNDKLDCISDLPKAKKMTEEECKEFKSMLLNSRMWVIDLLSEEFNNEEIKETTNGTDNN